MRTREDVEIGPRGGACSPSFFHGEGTYSERVDGDYSCWFDYEEPHLAWKHGANGVGVQANPWQDEGGRGRGGCSGVGSAACARSPSAPA